MNLVGLQLKTCMAYIYHNINIPSRLYFLIAAVITVIDYLPDSQFPKLTCPSPHLPKLTCMIRRPISFARLPC